MLQAIAAGSGGQFMLLSLAAAGRYAISWPPVEPTPARLETAAADGVTFLGMIHQVGRVRAMRAAGPRSSMSTRTTRVRYPA